jgi:hypothetical protein
VSHAGQFKPGQSGNPGWKVIHGFYKHRMRPCDACGVEYPARKLSSRFCSTRCTTAKGAWSYPANQVSNQRTLGVTKS